MVRILYTKYQLHISNGSKDIMSARKISCQQGFTIAIMAQSKKGHNFAILGPTEKIRVRLFFVLMLHINIQGSTHFGFTDWFPRYIKHLIFTKRRITLAIFDALRLEVNQHIFIW